MIVRFEPWGAWVKLEQQAALVALSRDGVRALGLDGGARWNEGASVQSAPIEVHLAVTGRCAVGCEGCYLDARPDGAEPAQAELLHALDALAEAGVFTVAFGGGEPTLRDDLGALADAARARGITPVVTTSGIGLGARKLEQLRRFAQVNVSYDGPSDAYAAVRGVDRAADAETAIAELALRGVDVGVNVVLTRATFERIPTTLRRARALGAKEAQLLRWKPAGRARSADYLAKRLAPEQAESLGTLLRTLAEEHGDALRIRIDCALVPFLSADPDIAARPEELARWGVLGCEAGAALGAARVDGKLAGCSFAGPAETAVKDLRRGWAGDRELARFRTFVEQRPEPCASCTLAPVCRGGCKVVAEHVSGAFGPDPECPRVRRSRA